MYRLSIIVHFVLIYDNISIVRQLIESEFILFPTLLAYEWVAKSQHTVSVKTITTHSVTYNLTTISYFNYILGVNYVPIKSSMETSINMTYLISSIN